jgi:NADH dehydrogenase FAD-containing subunit
MNQQLILIGGGHSHAIALREWGLNPLPNVDLTLISDVEQTPYSRMLPGHVAGFYSYDETHIEVWLSLRGRNSFAIALLA